jgi:hypothetical protein
MEQLLPALIGAITGLLAAYGRNLLDLRKEVSSDLSNKRFETYKDIWGIMQIMPKWPRAKDVTHQKLEDFSIQLRDWYFQKGGWLLSVNSRKDYGFLQECLQQAIKGKQMNDHITDSDYDTIQSACSKLRTQLTEDLQSRIRR